MRALETAFSSQLTDLSGLWDPRVHAKPRAGSWPAERWHTESRAVADDPLDQVMRESVMRGGLTAAPSDFTKRVSARLPAAPDEVAPQSLGTYEQLVACAKTLCGAASFSALLMFASTWVLALANPAFAFAVLATVVSVLILVLAGLRVAWETASGAASNPFVMLAAMAAPLVTFLLVGTQLSRISGRFFQEA